MSAVNDDNPTIFPTPTPQNYPFDPRVMLSTVIVLFLAIVVVMVYHTYSHWLFDRRRRLSSSSSDSAVPLPPPAAASGLDIAVLKSLPTLTFTVKDRSYECAVCLSEFEDGEAGRKLPNCGHHFHVACIDKWFGSHASCPLCRALVDWHRNDVVLTVVEENAMETTGGSTSLLGGLSKLSYSSCSCLVRKEAEYLQKKMEERCKELEKMCFCFAECKGSDNSSVPSLKRIWSV